MRRVQRRMWHQVIIHLHMQNYYSIILIDDVTKQRQDQKRLRVRQSNLRVIIIVIFISSRVGCSTEITDPPQPKGWFQGTH
jgi:hypothetical protein